MSQERTGFNVFTWVVLFGAGIVVAGCNTAATPEGAKPAAAAASPATPSASAGQDNAADSEIRAELAKLSPQDRALAEKQKVCPVTGEALGSMGVPYKVTLQGQIVFLCCEGCEAKLRKNAEQYLAKLKNADAK